MAARRALRDTGTTFDSRARAGRQIDEIKIALGEQGLTRWDDGSQDFNRHLANNTSYAEWFSALPINER